MTSAGVEFWDPYFRTLRESGRDLDWQGRWTEPFREPLRRAHARTVLELGCGTGNDAARLAGEGYKVTAADLSGEAIERARSRFGTRVAFLVADVSAPLPFRDDGFDAVMSNVALHMFSDAVTRAAFTEIGRVVRPRGLFLFHVNALEDAPLRARTRPVARELETNYVLENTGQTMHFFAESYLRELLTDWQDLRLDAVAIADPMTGEPFKQVWRGIALR
jgi:SAM-dependent methyltransferase